MREHVLVYDTGGGIKEVEVNQGIRRISGSNSLSTLESHLAEHAAILGTSYNLVSNEFIRVRDEGGGLREVPVTPGVRFIRSDSNKVTLDGHALEHAALAADTPLAVTSNEYVLVYNTGGGSRQVPVVDGCLFIEGERYLSTYSDHFNIHTTTGLPPGLDLPAIGRTLFAPLKSSLVLSEGTGSPTFTRATKAWGFNELGYLEEIASGCAFFGGARLVRNTVRTTSEDFSNAAWIKFGSITTPSANIIVCANATSAQYINQGGTLSLIPGQKLSYCIRAKKVVGGVDFIQIAGQSTTHGTGQFVNISLVDGTYSATGCFPVVTSLGGGVYDISVVLTCVAAGFDVYNIVFTNALSSTRLEAFVGDGIKSFELLRAWSVDVTNYDASYVPEYVSVGVVSSPFFGAGIDGAKYFETDWQGAPIPAASLLGFRREAAATNNLLYCRDLSNAAWSTKTNITAAKTATGIDGIANTATTLTATATDAIILQPITLASAARCASAYVKRRTGTGTISLTQDGGSTWTDITSQINSSAYSRVQITSTLANPSVGFKISTSGDAIDVDVVQNEAGSVATSPIITTTATVTRNADSLTYQTASNIDLAVGTIYSEVQLSTETTSRRAVYVGSTGASYVDGSPTVWKAYDGTNTVRKNGLSDATTAKRKRVVSWGVGMSVTGDGQTPASGSFDGAFGAAGTIDIGNTINGYIGPVAIYNYQMTDAELQGITA